jgi:hypothetical protein
LRVEIDNEKKKNHDCGLWKNWAEIVFFKVDKEEARMDETSDIGLGSGYEKIKRTETFCVDRVS